MAVDVFPAIDCQVVLPRFIVDLTSQDLFEDLVFLGSAFVGLSDLLDGGPPIVIGVKAIHRRLPSSKLIEVGLHNQVDVRV